MSKSEEALQTLVHAAKSVLPVLEYANSHGCECDSEMKDLQDAIDAVANRKENNDRERSRRP